MSSLLLKDFITLKSYLKTVLILIVFFSVMAFSYEEPSFLSGMIILTLSMLPITTFTYDNHSKWDLYSQTLPVSRKQMVLSKYVLGVIAIIAGAVLATILNIIVIVMKSLELDVISLLQGNSLIALVALVFLTVLFPLVYKFGVEKSRLLTILVISIPAAVVIGLSKMGVSLPDIDAISPNVLVLTGVVIAVCALAVSYMISLRMFEKKDF